MRIQAANSGRDPERARGEPLGALLCRAGLVTVDQLEEALQFQASTKPHIRLGQLLVQLGHVTAVEVAKTLADSVGLPFSHLSPDMVQAEALAILPSDYLERENLLPLSVSQGWLTIAVEKFTDLALKEDLARRSAHRVQIVAAEATNIRNIRESVFRVAGKSQPSLNFDESPLDDLLREMDVDEVRVVAEPVEDEDDLEATAAESPIVKLVNYVIKQAVDASASDIHIEPDERRFRVRYRIDGQLVTALRPPGRLHRAVVSRLKMLAGMDISERRLPQDGAITLTIAERAVDLRVSTMASRDGETVVMRVIDRDGDVRPLDALGLSVAMLEAFRSVIREPNGMVLITGPTGSGKTTTLYSVLATIGSESNNISTIEDPIERRLVGVNQFQVREQLGFTFARALRSMLRQDPDIIMVGEIRDLETARLATQAALTGHLVLSTLHTNDAPTAVPRLINMGVEPYLVAAALRGVLAQRLLRAICPGCREPQPLTPVQAALVERLCAEPCSLKESFRGVGCPRCHQRGYSGRVAVFDLLLLTEELLSSLARDPGASELRQLLRRRGMPGLLREGLVTVEHGMIELQALLELVCHANEEAVAA